MPKKSGKTNAAVAEVANEAVENTAAEKQEKERQVNLYVRNTSVQEHVSTKDGKEHSFKTVRFPMMVDGERKFASIAVKPGQVTPKKVAVRDENGEIQRDENNKVMTREIEDQSNVWLRGESAKVKVRIDMGKNEDGTWKREDRVYTAGEFEQAVKAGRADYAAEAKAKEVPQIESDEPTVEDDQLGG